MIQHYLKITFRNLVKYKLQSIISIMGLAVGIAFFIFSFYWLHYETSYDNFYPASIALSWSVIKQRHPIRYIFLPLCQHLSESIVRK